MADREGRKAELERKKARLMAMRAEKNKKEELRRKEAETSQGVITVQSDLDWKRDETSRILEGLGLPEQQTTGPVSPVKSVISNTTERDSIDAPKSPSVPKDRQPPRLTTAPVVLHTITPKELVKYAKETQTKQVEPEVNSEDDVDEVEVKPTEEIETVMLEEEDEAEHIEQKREYSKDEVEVIERDHEFIAFFDRATRVVERMLCEPKTDYFADYTGESGEQTHQLQADAVSEKRFFMDPHWSQHRLCTSLDWSPQFPELLAASYGENDTSDVDPDGVALIWNTKFAKDTPEYVFQCQSRVTKTKFAKYHPNLLIGGTYSGQIVIWDNRTFKRTPVQRTKLGASAHTHPVYCLDVIGSQNAHNLISVSTDGKMCSWSLDMLSKPQESLELTAKQSRAVSVTTLAFPGDTVNNFILGSEDGVIYSGQRHGNKKGGIFEVYERHYGPVTGLDCHRAHSKLDFSHLFITSSFDWTVKLWSAKKCTPIYSFENSGDYIMDVGWSPIHPALFASADLTGKLSFWNLNVDTEVPISSVQVGSGLDSSLNRLSWHFSGQMIATAAQNGKVTVFELGDSVSQPSVDESSRLNQNLNEMCQASEDNQPTKPIKRYDI